MANQLLNALDLADEGAWDAAHRIVQTLGDRNACWLHANLHREEGDLGNANYWYARAEKACPEMTVADERALIRTALAE
jgi:hypothetical protein